MPSYLQVFILVHCSNTNFYCHSVFIFRQARKGEALAHKELSVKLIKIGIVGVESNWVHLVLLPPVGILCQPLLIMMMEKLVE
jgi:hypothetical protein